MSSDLPKASLPDSSETSETIESEEIQSGKPKKGFAAYFTQDVVAWVISMIFIIVWIGAMWAWGIAENWYALSGYYHKGVNTSEERFLEEPFGCNETIPGRDSNECTATWYYWKLPPAEVTALTQAIVWIFYCAHQIFIWALIYSAQLVTTFRKKGKRKYKNKLRWYNWALLGVNAIFHVLHLVQTHWTYDGTAQDVAISSSQASVIMMICFILLMEYKDRGVMFMWPNPKSDDVVAKYLRLNLQPIELIRKYHGIAFSWASIYTFWYHPMENTWGHTTGFFHTAIVMLQGSLIYTDMHLNRYWRLVTESWVVIHGTMVAVQTGDPDVAGGSSTWPIFGFGFGLIFFFTQIYSLPFWKKISPYFRVLPPAIFLATVTALCGTVVQGKEPGQTGFGRMYEMFFIPAEEYMMLFVSWLYIYALIKLESALLGDKRQEPQSEASIARQVLVVSVVVLIYGAFIGASVAMRDTTHNLLVMMIIFVFIFSAGVSITVILFKQITGPFRNLGRSRRVSEKADINANKGESNRAFSSEQM